MPLIWPVSLRPLDRASTQIVEGFKFVCVSKGFHFEVSIAAISAVAEEPSFHKEESPTRAPHLSQPIVAPRLVDQPSNGRDLPQVYVVSRVSPK